MGSPIALIAGLGNPGQQYQHNRHNAGAIFLSALCCQGGIELKADKKFQGLAGSVMIKGSEVRLLFPTTYMNHSGRAVAAIASYYKIAPQQILVAYDELDLPLGTTRLKSGGGHGGHNGIRDIIAVAGPDFVRVRVGIGRPPGRQDPADFVLSPFSKTERDVLPNLLVDAADATVDVVENGLLAAQQRWHGPKD